LWEILITYFLALQKLFSSQGCKKKQFSKLMLKQFYQLILGVFFLSLGLTSCGGESQATKGTTTPAAATPPTTTDTKAKVSTQEVTTPAVKIDWNADELLIQEAGLSGVFVGQPLSGVESRIKKELSKSGTGEFVAYYFTGKNKNTLGYFTLDPEDQSLIGDVVVTSPDAATKDGIKVGSTFGDLKVIAPNLEVHGSATDSRTHAFIGRTAYLLDVAFNTYELDANQVKPSTKIKEIRLMRDPRKKL
jgi:hypothetical protein